MPNVDMDPNALLAAIVLFASAGVILVIVLAVKLRAALTDAEEWQKEYRVLMAAHDKRADSLKGEQDFSAKVLREVSALREEKRARSEQNSRNAKIGAAKRAEARLAKPNGVAKARLTSPGKRAVSATH